MSKINQWLLDTFASYIVAKNPLPIDQWAEHSVMLPSNTSEPGRYSADRCPYQRQIMKDASPDSPVQKIVLCWGSQTGKTTCESNIMMYYISEFPVAQAFGFSDDANLKNFVKNKFNPTLSENPRINQLLQSIGGRGSGNTITGKSYPGGFIKFLSGKSGASLRSDSVMVFIADELDAWGITKDGDPDALIKKRTNTFGSRRKIIESSTPLNSSIINEYLLRSTNNHYFIPCPLCNEDFELTMGNFHWAEENGIILDAWFECPHCHNIIHNDDKLTLLPLGHWVSTNEKADPLNQGYYLPTFYAPVGWITWKDIAQEYYDACLTSKGVDYDKMTAFCNTILAIPYVVGSESNDWRILYENSLSSPYKRGFIPDWVSVLTTGGDVQGNRLEVTLMGWGFRGRNIVIDHYVFMLGADEHMDSIDNTAFTAYKDTILNGTFEREDGFRMKSLANALDHSYLPDTISAFQLSLNSEERKIFFPVQGNERLTGTVPAQKFVKRVGLAGATYYDVPINHIKHQIYDNLKLEDNQDQTVAFIPFFPADFDTEFYQQLYSEYEVMENRRLIWKKNRDRNEILDCRVYNHGMFYLLGLGCLTDEDWESILSTQKQQNRPTRKPHNRQLSSGFVL